MSKFAYSVFTDAGNVRNFSSFNAAEKWARKWVAGTGSKKFAQTATIENEMTTVADVRLDALGRVWTNMKGESGSTNPTITNNRPKA